MTDAERKAKWKEEHNEKYVSGYKKYTAEHKAKKAEYDRRLRTEKRDEYLARKKKYYETHKETHKKYQSENKEHRKKIMDAWKAEHNSEINAYRRVYTRERRKNDEDFAIKSCIRLCFRRMVSDGKTWRDFFSLAGYTYDDYLNHFNANYKEEFARYRSTKEYHIDHIIPCSAYNFTENEDIKKCWNPRNLRIISVKENMDKSDKIDIALIKQYGILDLMPKGWKLNG